MSPLLAMMVALMALVAGHAGAAPPPESGRGAAEGRRYDPDHVLVAFQPGTTEQSRAEAHRRQGGRVENRFEHLNLDVVRVPRGQDPPVVAGRYQSNPNVDYAHPNWEVRLLNHDVSNRPNDTLFRDLWGLHNTGQLVTGSLVAGKADADIDAPEGWEAAFGHENFPSSGGVRVGVLDTGIDRTHVDLLNKTQACATAVAAIGVVTEGTCSDDNLHGTHVAGTVAALTNNSVGVAGVAPNAELAVFKALNAAGVGFYADVIAGIHWLHTKGGTQIISMSIGGPQDEGLDDELTEAYGAGVLLVAAAGNDGDSTENYPAHHPDVVSVAATNQRDEKASFSNCNADVEVAAPGVDIWSTTPGNSYAPLDGTSMATPHASGVAAMIWSWSKQQSLDWSASDVRQQLTSTTNDLGAAGRDTCFGHGRINLARALDVSEDPGAIAGTVTDASSKAGIGEASVDCGSGGKATTASDGTYTISNAPVGAYTCTASAAGSRSKSQSVNVNSGQTSTANFALRKR